MTTNIATDLPTLPVYTEDDLVTLSPSALVELLIRDEDRVPRNVIDRCAQYGEEMVEHLRARLDDEHAWRFDVSSGEWWLRLHAAMILGLIESASAGLLLVQLMRRMSLAEDDDLQDWLAGYWPALFANKPPATIEAARALREDQTIDWYIRCQAVDVVVGAASRAGNEPLERELDWLAARVSDNTDDRAFRMCGADRLLDFPRERHREMLIDMAQRETTRAAEREWIPVHISLEEIEVAFEQQRDTPEWHRFEDPWHFYARGSIARRLDRWAEEAAGVDDDLPDTFNDLLAGLPTLPYIRPLEKIGRNDPCPCGSGKKYKKCCLPKELT